MKFYCDSEGFRENWVEVSERWTNAEAKELDKAMSAGWADYLEIVRRKVVSCRLDSVSNPEEARTITNPEEITEEVIDAMDLIVSSFVGGILQQTVARLKSLGNVSARVSLPLAAGKS